MDHKKHLPTNGKILIQSLTGSLAWYLVFWKSGEVQVPKGDSWMPLKHIVMAKNVLTSAGKRISLNECFLQYRPLVKHGIEESFALNVRQKKSRRQPKI